MLPLSRTPTIQATSQAYTQSSLDERDLEEQLGEADEAYENEYHSDYPVISISNNRLQSLSPTSPIAAGGIGTLFRLPNRDIGVSTSSPALTPSGGIIHSSSLMTHSTGPAATPTTVIAPLGGASTQQHQTHNQQSTHHLHNHHGNASERHDPIERLLLLKAQQEGDTTSQQQLESAINPALQFLQRTRTVANWAQEQSRIQEKRERHYARARALKELRKHDPTATLSVHSESSSSFSDFSSLSSFSTSTSSSASTSKFVPVTSSSQQRHHRQQQQQQQYSAQVRAPPSLSLPKEKPIVNTKFGEGLSSGNAGGGTNGKMPSFSRHFNTSLVVDPTLMEDIQLDQPTRLEMLIQEEDEEGEEEPGLYIDTDDVLSPSMEIESLGAGVGRL
ncbi:MAG: hypothetical protein J3R72DRAFT_442023 [Linnemannia gamsii]|nr:MAG: hypothetical protein J3R72DRAFT_442023 [Linnemannia gamsii]